MRQPLDLPADYDHVLVLLVFSDSYLQPVFQQATDLYELGLRWNRARTRFKAGAVRWLTETGKDGWVIPEFAWDPSGSRLREAFVTRLAGVHDILQIPLGITQEMRTEAAKLLGSPSAYPFQGLGCGGDVPPQPGAFEQQTRLGRFEQ